MVTNPPYGRRLLETGVLPRLYAALGNVFRSCFVGWNAAVLTEVASLGKSIAIRSPRQHTLYNGAVACQLLHFEITPENYFGESRLTEEQLSIQSADFRNRLLKNLRQRLRCSTREGVDCYRLYDADLPNYSAAIDVYANAAAPDQRWVCIQEYETPKKVEVELVKRRTREIRTVAQDAENSASGQQNTIGQPRPQTGPIGGLQRACKLDAGTVLPNGSRT